MAKLSFISNSDILKLLSKLGTFGLLFVLLNTGLSMLLSRIYFSSQGGNSGAQINYLLKQRNQILVFGASRAMHHYIPAALEEETGLSAYNAGDDGKNSTYQLGLLKMLLTQYQPKAIIYDVGDYTASLDGGTVDLYPYYYRYRQVEDLLEQRDHYASFKFKFHLYAYNQKIFTIIRGYLGHVKPNITGYHPLRKTIRQEEIDVYYKNLPSLVEPKIDKAALKNFGSFIELCKKNNIRLILSYSPRLYEANFQYLKMVDSLAAYYNVPYLNFGNDPDYLNHRELFQDIEHLNHNGAELFTEEIGEDLNEYLSQR